MGHAHQHPGALLPPGLVASKAWLMGRGVHRHTVDNWVKSGQVVAVARGVFMRPEAELTGQGVACSLQRMELDLTPGGLTALELQGLSHYLSMGSRSIVQLYGSSLLPTWVNHVLPGTSFERHPSLEFDRGEENPSVEDSQRRVLVMPFGKERCTLGISSPELAFLEVLMGVPHLVTFEHVDNLLQGLPNLSPRKLTPLLEHCQNVKVKRLFLWLAGRNQSPWLKQLDLRRFSIEAGTLGSGKRVIAKGGKLDRRYLITVPPEMAVERNG